MAGPKALMVQWNAEQSMPNLMQTIYTTCKLMHFKTFSSLILKTHYLKGTIIVNVWHN